MLVLRGLLHYRKMGSSGWCQGGLLSINRLIDQACESDKTPLSSARGIQEMVILQDANRPPNRPTVMIAV
jgi:hypothetical protein